MTNHTEEEVRIVARCATASDAMAELYSWRSRFPENEYEVRGRYVIKVTK